MVVIIGIGIIILVWSKGAIVIGAVGVVSEFVSKNNWVAMTIKKFESASIAACQKMYAAVRLRQPAWEAQSIAYA